MSEEKKNNENAQAETPETDTDAVQEVSVSEETKKPVTEEKKEEKGSFWRDVWDFVLTLLISMGVVFLLSQFVIRPIRVEGSSMYPTLQDNEFGFANVAGVELNHIERFDIAVVYLPQKDIYLVKRVIGLPGETVSYQDGNLYINGEMIPEDFLDEDYKAQWGDDFMSDVEEFTLGEEEYYCLGDNRPESRDSRYYGPFTKDQIIAKGAFIVWPFRAFGVKSW